MGSLTCGDAAALSAKQSAEFERRWARQDSRRDTTGMKAFLVPGLGRFDLAYEILAVGGPTANCS